MHIIEFQLYKLYGNYDICNCRKKRKKMERKKVVKMIYMLPIYGNISSNLIIEK